MSVAAIGAVDYAKALDGLSLKQAQLMLTTQGIVGEEQKDLLVKQGLIATSDRMSASIVSEALASTALNKEQQEAILIKAGLMKQKTKELITSNACTEAELRAILAEKGIKGAKADTLIASILQTGQNSKEALSWKVLGASAKEAMVAMLHNPLTWVIAGIASIGLLVKGYDAVIGKQEKLSRTKIEGLDEDISKLDEEIRSLEELQSKLEDAKGSRYELSQIQTELNDAIGETQGLLNGESKAWDVANAKLKANIELKKQQRKQAQQDKVNESKVLYDNNVIEIDWHTDKSGEKARGYAKALGVMETYTDGKTDWESYLKFIESDDYKNLSQEVKTALDDAMTFKTTYDTEWAEYLKEQAETALSVFDETISNYDGAGGQQFIKGLISDMAQDGASLSEISDVVTQVIENQDMQDAINKYWESLVNPDINSEEALQAVKKIFDDTVAKNPALKDFFDNFYNGIVAGGKAATDTSSDVNKMTDSLDSLSSAIKAAESAFELFNEVEKDFNSTGAISTENIQKILNKFPDLEDELYEYIMGMRTGASVMDLLKTKSDDMATMSADAFKKMYLSSNAVSNDIKDDYQSAFKLIGLEWNNTQSIMSNVNTQIVDANGQVTQTFVEQWTEACKLAGANVSSFAQGISALLGGDFYDGTSGIYRVKGKGIYYKDGSGMDGAGTNLVNVKAMELIESGQYKNSSDAYKAAYNILSNQFDKSWENQAEFERRQKEFEERMKQYAFTSDDKSGSDKNEALDNYLKDAENRYKIHQDETKYIEELQWAHDNLTKDEKERLDIIGKINEAYRDLADNRIKDLEHQIDLKKELYGDDYDATAELSEIQRVAHEEANRLRSMGYDDNSNEIQELQKTWWDAENEKLDFYSKQYENRVRDIEHARDMALSKDKNVNVTSFYKQLQEEYHKEAERLRLLDPEKYKEEIQELQQLWWDAQNEMLDYNKEVVDDFLNELQDKLDNSYDIRISRLNSQSSLLSSHYEVVNAIAEEQHNLNKELLEAETIGAKMNEQERQSLLTKEEHNRLSGKLSDIMLDINDLQGDYMHDLKNATEDTIEEITNHYERQYELKMKEFEIVRAELDLMKKRQILENTENEKSVRTWNGSSWVYEANLQDVLDAQADVEDAKYELARAQAESAQQLAINAIDANADALQTEKNKLATAIEEMAEKMEGSGKDITSMLQTIAETDLPTFDAIIQSAGKVIKEGFGISDSDIDGIRRSGGGSAITADAIAQMKANSDAWHNADKDTQTKLSDANKAWGKVLGLDYEDSTGRWKKKDGTYAYAKGTRNAKKGRGIFDEDGFGSEVILTNDGILTQFNGGERVFSPEMADRLWDMAQQNFTFTPVINQPDFGKLVPLEDRISNVLSKSISNISNAFGDTYMIKDVQLNESEGGTLKGFMDFLKKKI